jgi:hypothetical protein
MQKNDPFLPVLVNRQHLNRSSHVKIIPYCPGTYAWGFVCLRSHDGWRR